MSRFLSPLRPVQHALALILIISLLTVVVATLRLLQASVVRAAQDPARRSAQAPPPDAELHAAAEFQRRKRVPDEAAAIQAERYLTAREQMRRLPQYATVLGQLLSAQAESEQLTNQSTLLNQSAAHSPNWTPLGPGNIGGRTRALVIHPTNPEVIYAAGAASGVWRTVDNGASWQPIGDLLPNLAVNALALEPGNPSVLYAGTGEGFFNAEAVRGAGIFKTIDGGASWTRLAGTETADFYYVNDIVVSPVDNRRIYAATLTGVWRSVDDGASWERVLDPKVNGGCLDLVIRTDQTTDYLFTACGTFGPGTIYRNTDAAGAGAWTAVLNEQGMGRTSLALAPSNQDIIYAAAASFFSANNHGLHTIFRSTNGGAAGSWTAQVRGNDANKLNTLLFSFTQLATASLCGLGADRIFNTGWHANVIAVDPRDAQRVWVGGADLFRSDDGGVNWGLASYLAADPAAPQYLHSNHHALVFHPQYDGAGNQQLFVAGDGGLARTDNARAAVALGALATCDANNSQVRWTSLNRDYAVTLFYHGAVFPDGKSYFGGAQNHGFLRGSDAGGVNGWQPLYGGDGGHVAIDPSNPDTLYAMAPVSAILKSTDGGRTFALARTGLSEASGNFVYAAPLAIDPSDGARLWTGGRTLWRTTNGASHWEAASFNFPGGGPQTGQFTAVAVAPSDANFVAAGTNAGFVHFNRNALTANAGMFWQFTKPRDGFVSSVAFDPSNPEIVYATYSTFGDGHVWRSENGGAGWTSIDGALPDVPVNCLVVDPHDGQRLFIGTDVGVFVSIDGGATWAVEAGLPNVVIETLVFNTAGGATSLYAFTRGRGVWRVGLRDAGCAYTLSTNSVSLSQMGGAGSVRVTAASGCDWSAMINESGQGWLNITISGATINYSVAPNLQAATRVGTINIAGRSFTVTQAGAVDLLPPRVIITNPTTAATLTTRLSALALSGTATDDVEITQVAWSNDRSPGERFSPPPSGIAAGTSDWDIPAIPLRAGVNTIVVTARDISGRTGTATLTVLNVPPGTRVPIAGNGETSFNGDNRPALSTALEDVSGPVIDASGNIYFIANSRVRRLSPFTGIINTVAGGGARYEDGVPAREAVLLRPFDVALDNEGNLYVSEYDGNRVRRIGVDGMISTVAGKGTRGFSGDGGPAIQAQFNSPAEIVVDASSNLYIADRFNFRVRKVTREGLISTVAGGGQPNTFNGDGGPAIHAAISQPAGLALDQVGDLYLTAFSTHAVRKVTFSTGIITTMAGNIAESGFQGDGEPASHARFRDPRSLVFDRAGNLYIWDLSNARIRRIDAATGLINTFLGGDAFPAGGNLGFDHAGHLLLGSYTFLHKLVPFMIPDLTPPQLVIAEPTAQPTLELATNRNFRLSGTATDNQLVTHVSWLDDRGRSGFAAITCCGAASNWNVTYGAAPLPAVTNYTVTAWDAWGNHHSATLKVIFNATSVVKTVAGNLSPGFGGDGEPGRNARLWQPEAIALDAAGNLYIADAANHRVRKLTPGGLITTIAGNGTVGSSGDGGPASAASLNNPRGLAVDAQGNIYIADTGNHRVRKVTPAGLINTIAGTGLPGFGGDNEVGTNAHLDTPLGLAVDAIGNLYIADANNHRVRKLAAATNVIITSAGGGFGFSGDGGPATQARLKFPGGVAIDEAGNLYIADAGNYRVRKVTAAGVITTFAGNGQFGHGNDGAPAINSPLTADANLALDRAGNLYIAAPVLKRVDTNGVLRLIAGHDLSDFNFRDDDGEPAAAAQFISPRGVAVDVAGNVYVADTGRHRIAVITPHRTAANVQAASFAGSPLAAASINAAFGVNLANATQSAAATPLPNELAGTTVRVRDSAGIERLAPLFFVSPAQVNYQLPPDTAPGSAEVRVTSGQGQLAAETIQVAAVAPGLFAANANGRGVAAAVALRITSDGRQIYEPVAQFDGTQFVARPLDLGPATDQLFLLLFGTGVRGHSALANVTAKIGDEDAPVLYAGAQGGFVGLDQINLRLPRSLRGRGPVAVQLLVDGQLSNAVQINIAGEACANVIAPATTSFNHAGGAGSVNVIATADCAWTATSRIDWISVTSAADGAGNGHVQFIVAANPGLAARTGTLRIAGQIFTVTQTGLNDVDAPHITITQPAADSASSALPATVIGGTASAPAGIGMVVWSNDRGQSGVASGTTQWQAEAVPLRLGDNVITVTAYNAQGRSRSARVTITYRPEFVMQTIAGGGESTPGNGGPATAAQLNNPLGLALDAAGNIYIGTSGRVMKVTTAGIISTIAGVGQEGFGQDNIPATASALGRVGGLAFDRAGNLHLADLDTNRIRRIDAATGLITTVAGLSRPDNSGFSGDGGLAVSARLNQPNDLAFDHAGNLYIADTLNHRIRRVDAVTKIITTIAGNGREEGALGDNGPATAAVLRVPRGLAFDQAGDLFIASDLAERVRKVALANGVITTIAGGGENTPGDGGPATAAAVRPQGLAFDRHNNLYLTDYARLRRVAAGSGMITTVAGTGVYKYGGDGGPAVEVPLSSPIDVAVDNVGNIYLLDSGRVRKLTPFSSGSTVATGVRGLTRDR